jgi:hypothetical protein
MSAAKNSTHPVVAELSRDGDRINVTFDYSPQRVKLAKRVSGYTFVNKEKARAAGLTDAFWRYPLDLVTGRRLREVFGDELGIGPKLRAWGNKEVTKEQKLATLSDADDADLSSDALRKLVKGTKNENGDPFKLRPYQKADIRFASEGKAVIIANQPRTGKTITAIGTVIESGLEYGWHLVFAPVASLRTVWEAGIKDAYRMAGLEEPVVLTGDTPNERKKAIQRAAEMADAGESFYLVLNPYHARLKRVSHGKGDQITFTQEPVSPELMEIDWDSMIIDEYHLMGLSNPITLGAKGVNEIATTTQPELRLALSGTPMGGKPIKLWGALHFLNPEEFTSRWNWAKHWLVVKSESHPGGSHSVIEGIMPGREVDFYDHLKPYLVRRTQREALPGLPEMPRVNVWCDMTPRQSDQYQTFLTEAEWRMDDAEEAGRLTATNVLAEYTRLKQFADGFCEVHKTGKVLENGLDQLRVSQTPDSGKLIQLVEKLREENVITESDDDDEPRCALIASQFNDMVKMVAGELTRMGVPNAIIGKYGAKGAERDALVKAFQEQTEGAPRVLLMNTLAGTALTLDRASSVHMLDETWVPDNQEQMENRATATTQEAIDRGCGVYYYRTRNTVESAIQKKVAGKAMNNHTILDLRREMKRQAEQEERRLAGERADDGKAMLAE